MKGLRVLMFMIACLSVAPMLLGQGVLPIITNLTATADVEQHLMAIEFDLIDEDSEFLRVSLSASSNGGVSYRVLPENMNGDVGENVSMGVNKQIIWDYADIENIENYRIKVSVDDYSVVDIGQMAELVDSLRLINDLSFIVGVRNRNTGLEHLEGVKEYINTTLSFQGIPTEWHDFDFEGYTASTINGLKAGLHDETQTLIIDGHFDSVDISPGADDNGSAIAGMLEAARILSLYTFKKNIRFLGFDLEEEGLLGSIDYVSNHIDEDEQINGVFNFEMIGYYTEEPNTQTFPIGFELLYPDQTAELEANEYRGDFITNIGDAQSESLNAVFDSCANLYVPELSVISLIAPPFSALSQDFYRSDHASFWFADIPALMLTDGANFRNPNYHTPNDTFETINFTFMSNVVKATIASVAALAEPVYGSSATADVELGEVLSISKLQLSGVHIWPNPSDGEFVIEWDEPLQEKSELSILDIKGEVLVQVDLPIGTNKWKLKLDQYKGYALVNIKKKEKSWTDRVLIH